MATTTTTLKLTKPAATDAAEISVINANMDTIDTQYTAANQTTIANVITMQSGYTATTAATTKRGGIVMLDLVFKTNSARTEGSSFSIGTLAAAYRPLRNSALICGNDANVHAVVTTAGTITVKALGAIAASGTITLRGTYLAAL